MGRGSRTAVVCVLAAGFVVCLLAGCTSMSPDEKAVRATIERYNDLLADGYRALNMSGLREVASQTQAEDEYVHMSSLAEGGVRLDPALKNLLITDVSVEATAAHAQTRETWDYRHYSRANGNLVLEEKGLVYVLAWDLAKEPSGKWVVTDVRAISATSTTEPEVLGTITPTPPKQ